MKRITIIVSAADMPAIRKVVFMAGAEKLVIAKVPHQTCIGELGDWYCGTHIAQREDHMRLEVTSDDKQSDGVISAILSTAHAAKIERIISSLSLRA
jgi:nitrogen regulatory protein PII